MGEDHGAGAALLGVTPPTYERWLDKYEIGSKGSKQDVPSLARNEV